MVYTTMTISIPTHHTTTEKVGKPLRIQIENSMVVEFLAANSFKTKTTGFLENFQTSWVDHRLVQYSIPTEKSLMFHLNTPNHWNHYFFSSSTKNH